MLGELKGIVIPTLRERIDKSIVGNSSKLKLISGYAFLLKKLNLLVSLQRNFTNESLENFREGESV